MDAAVSTGVTSTRARLTTQLREFCSLVQLDPMSEEAIMLFLEHRKKFRKTKSLG
eukprot:gene21053-7890_t